MKIIDIKYYNNHEKVLQSHIGDNIPFIFQFEFLIHPLSIINLFLMRIY